MFLKKLILPVFIALGIAFLSGLGFWQLERMAWKEGLIARVEKQLTGAPSNIEEISQRLSKSEDIEYRPIKVSGRFLHDKEQFFFSTHNGQSGWFIYTPLQRADDSVVFVNRGFVPMVGKDPATRQKGQVSGEVSIVGLARSAPQAKPNSFVPDNDLVKNVFYWKSLPQMAERANLKADANQLTPFFVDANDAPNPGGWPKGGVTLIEFPNTHLQYALTWFGLAFALLCVGGAFMWSSRKTSNNQT